MAGNNLHFSKIIFPNHLRDFTKLLRGVETAIYENPQFEIDPSYDDVKED